MTGAGKSTVLTNLRRQRPHPFVAAGGYGGGARPPNEFHRDLLTAIRRQLARNEFLRLDWSVESLVVQAELLLADRTIVEPAIQRGDAVVYEHHHWSVLAYQAARIVEARLKRGIEPALRHVRAALAAFPVRREPDVILYLDVPDLLASQRAAHRDGRDLTPAASRFNRLVADAYKILLLDARQVVRVQSSIEAIDSLRAMVAQ